MKQNTNCNNNNYSDIISNNNSNNSEAINNNSNSNNTNNNNGSKSNNDNNSNNSETINSNSNSNKNSDKNSDSNNGSNNIIEITSLTSEGQGVGRLDNLAVFVDGAIPGDRVNVEITKRAKTYAIGKIKKILSASKDRIEPPCIVAKRCGGCSLQQMNYLAQCKCKQNGVQETMNRIGGFDRATLQSITFPILFMKEPYNYRNNVQLTISGTSDCPSIGFLENNSHVVVDSFECLVMHPVGNAIREAVRNFIIQKNISIYQENFNSGLLRNLIIRIGINTNQVMVIIVLSKKDLSFKTDLVQILKEATQENNMELISVFININNQQTNIILGKELIPIYGREYIEEILCGITYRISPTAFFQVNTLQAELMFEKVVEFADLSPQDTVFDIYCGTGSISLLLARHCKKVIGIEIVEQAISDAKENALQNKIINTEFFAGKAEIIFPEFVSKGIHADAVVVDPPRKGLDAVLLESIVKMSPPKIIYVSCNPATLARDCKYLCKNGGYILNSILPVDLFPWSHHVECIGKMVRM